MTLYNRLLIILLACAIWAVAYADETETSKEGENKPVIVKEPPLPPVENQILEPSVIITPNKKTTIKEYKVNGQVYMIVITPKKGVPYYLVDTDGDGNLETRHEIGPNILIPSWVILRW
jgi:hypothetical protein